MEINRLIRDLIPQLLSYIHKPSAGGTYTTPPPYPCDVLSSDFIEQRSASTSQGSHLLGNKWVGCFHHFLVVHF